MQFNFYALIYLSYFALKLLGCALSLALLGVRIPGVRFRNTNLKISRRLIYSNYNMGMYSNEQIPM